MAKLYGCSAEYSINTTDSELCVKFHDNIRAEQQIPLRHTTPNYPGIRWWFLCPRCNRRASLLYKPSNSRCFFCRCCHDLTYESAQTSRSRVAKFLKAAAKEMHMTTRQARQWIRWERDPAYVQGVKRPIINKVRDRRTGLSLLLTKQTRNEDLTI
jgi:hypothetical protein